MKGRLVSLHGSLAALLFAAAGLAGSACTSSEQQTDLIPEGPPTILQVFVDSIGGNGLIVNDPSFSTPSHGLIDGSDLAFGLQPNVGFCTFDLQCPSGSGLTCKHFQVLRLEADLCVDASDTQPGITDGEPTFPIIQVVFKELLQGSTVEGFECDCNSVGACPGGKIFTSDQTCGDCPDSPTTVNDDETGRCTDVDGDGVNDHSVILPGVYTIVCENGYSYTNLVGEGAIQPQDPLTPDEPGTFAIASFYDPSGNQFVAIDTGFESLGPRLYLLPQGPMPTNSLCTFTIGAGVTDKDGNAVAATARPITWTTAPMGIIATAPEADEDGIDATMLESIVVTFVAPIGTFATDAITVTAGAAPFPGSVEADGVDLIFTPTAAFAAGTTYTVTVAAGTEDTFGQALAEAFTFSFMTAP